MNYEDEVTAGEWVGEDTALPNGFFDEIPKPLYWRVLIMPTKPKEKSAGGIVLAKSNQDAQEVLNSVAVVVALGPTAGVHERLGGDGKNPAPGFPKVGEYVNYGKYAGQPILYSRNGITRTLRVVNDDELLCVVPNPNVLQSSV